MKPNGKKSDCEFCEGVGFHFGNYCPACDGTGKERIRRFLQRTYNAKNNLPATYNYEKSF